jgi:hypothetical protein
MPTQTRKNKKGKKVNVTQPAYILKQKLKKLVNKRLDTAKNIAAANELKYNTPPAAPVGKRKRAAPNATTVKKPKKSKSPWGGPRNTINYK